MKTYKVTLNWHGEIHTIHTQADSKREALGNAIVRLANYLDRTHYSVRVHFLDGKDRFKVEGR